MLEKEQVPDAVRQGPREGAARQLADEAEQLLVELSARGDVNLPVRLIGADAVDDERPLELGSEAQLRREGMKLALPRALLEPRAVEFRA